jgi:hypothetical protein
MYRDKLNRATRFAKHLPKHLLRIVALVLPAAIVLVLGPFTQANSATAGRLRQVDRPVICSTSFNPYTQLVSVLRACGDRIEWLQHVTALPGGGKAYSYGDYTTLVPPAGFNVLNASDEQLSEYGFPTRKQLGSGWYDVMRHVRSFAQPTPYLVEDPNAQMGLPVPAATARLASSTYYDYLNWAGYVVDNHQYTEVTATWIEPRMAGGCSNDDFSQWVGMGGFNGSGDLGQDGTAFNEQGIGQHQGWIETIENNDNSPAVPVEVWAHPGYGFYASTLWDAAQGKFYYYMEDYYTGRTSSNESRVVSADQSSVEVISERTHAGSGWAELTNFQVVTVQDDRAYWNSSSSGFYYDSANTINMVDTYGNLVAYPSLMATDSSFYTYWNRCN